MQHLDHDRLVFLALGESQADSGESTHLDSCEHCRVQMRTLQHVAGLGTETQGMHELPNPPEHVWQGIVAEIRAAEDLPSLPASRRQSTAEPTNGSAGAGGVSRSDRSRARRRGRWAGWAATAVTAVAAAAVGVVGTVAVLRPDKPEPAATQAVVASAPLAAYGKTPKSAHGDARVLEDGQLHLHVANLPRVPGYYEVWLINPENGKMFSIGTLGDNSDALLPLSSTVDLRSYSVVDVSAEQYDNNTKHSGDSLLRGTLTG
ncbi:anti-sigma factor [Micromonospora sp. 067-2]|uniref:anti-sigma factor n=1 Tax=Micromonospora sp. 067-2 TaxID=2789270 RepID=UPI003978AAF3